MSFSSLYLPFVFAGCSIFLPHLPAFLAFSLPASHQLACRSQLNAYVPSNSAFLTSLLILKWEKSSLPTGLMNLCFLPSLLWDSRSLEEEWLSFPACPAGGCNLSVMYLLNWPLTCLGKRHKGLSALKQLSLSRNSSLLFLIIFASLLVSSYTSIAGKSLQLWEDLLVNQPTLQAW